MNKDEFQDPNTVYNMMRKDCKCGQTKIECSFCLKQQSLCKKLIAGPNGVFICDECIELCCEIINEEKEAYKIKVGEDVEVPKDRREKLIRQLIKSTKLKSIDWKSEAENCYFDDWCGHHLCVSLGKNASDAVLYLTVKNGDSIVHEERIAEPDYDVNKLFWIVKRQVTNIDGVIDKIIDCLDESDKWKESETK